MIGSSHQDTEPGEAASIVKAEIPADEFALGGTFGAVPDASFRCERIVESGDQTVMPLLWAYDADPDQLEHALRDDPSVETASLITAFDDKLLYRVEWADRVHLVVGIITNAHATVLDLYGDDGTWTLRLLYPDRESLSHTHQFCDDHRLELDIQSIRELDGENVDRFGLTSKQHEALVAACERGYFHVPRETDLHALAEELGVSHQALSERLRRATSTLVREAILTDSSTRAT